MSIQRLERVMWRLRALNKGASKANRDDLRLCIMKEIGTSPTCVKENIRALKALKWIEMGRGKFLTLTGKDISD